VLGLIELSGEATPYELKTAVNLSLGNFWSLQHAQLYSEPERLAQAGYLKERREETGRRRRHYSLTKKGRDALAAWREETPERVLELRDLGLLKVFFGADPAQVAESQLEMHRRKLAEYEGLKRLDVGGPPRGPWLTLDAGIRHTKTSIEFWEQQRGKRRRRG
jgi:PadR family transcriptional regulator, regulatory protein AphA